MLNNLFNNTLYEKISTAFLLRIIGTGCSFLLTFTIANFYGSGALGYFALVQTYIMIVSIFSKLGLDTA